MKTMLRPAVAQPAQDGEQPLDLRRRQRRGRLVEDDDARARKTARARARRAAAGRAARRPSRVARVDVDAEARAGARAPRAPSRASRRARSRLTGCVPRKTFSATLRSRHDAEFLVHHADAGGERVARRAEADRPAVERASARRTRACTPAMIFISVHLPAPFSPTSPWISPARSAKSTSRSAVTPPNDLARCRRSASQRAARRHRATRRSDQEVLLHPQHAGRVGLGDDRAVGDDVLRDAARAGLLAASRPPRRPRRSRRHGCGRRGCARWRTCARR